jgi:hypothetical protein
VSPLFLAQNLGAYLKNQVQLLRSCFFFFFLLSWLQLDACELVDVPLWSWRPGCTFTFEALFTTSDNYFRLIGYHLYLVGIR